MRGSIAEEHPIEEGAGDQAGRGARGSRRTALDDRRRSSMAGNRGHGQPWEVHLGSLQIVIWSGLAVGAIIGSYFLGFFSGRFVGFETARSASGIEVAKLTLTDELPEQSSPSVSAIYDKLNAPLSLNDISNTKSVNGAQQPSEPPPGVQAAQAIKEGERQRQNNNDVAKAGILGDAAGSKAANADKAVRGTTGGREGAAAAAEIDSLFDGQDSGAVDDSDALAVTDTHEKSVRLLGGAPGSAASASSDKTLGAMLEERLAKARRENEKSVIVAEGNQAPRVEIEKQDSTAKNAAAKTAVTREDSAPKSTAKAAPATSGKTTTASDVEKTGASSAPVRQVLPSGYFAQVAAPKRMADAQEVARKLKKSGFPVVIEEADVRGESFFRVLVGPEENKVQADRLVGQLQRERYLSGAPFVKRVK